MPITTERGKIAHLLRRAGFVPSMAELDVAEAKGLTTVIDELLNFETVPDAAEMLYPADSIDYRRPQTMPLWWLLRMRATSRLLQEKMTLFWHGHLTSGLSRVGPLRFTMVAQNEFFRRNALGNYREIITGVSKDPAMIQWLDNNTNRKGKPNENYARELFELFTLGRDNYTEQDIREAARAFTGWFQRDGVFVFATGQHDTDRKTIFGKTGNWDGGDVCDMAVSHAAAGPFLATTLWEFFAYRRPEPEVVNELADAYYRSGYDIRAVMRALLTHSAFYSQKAYHALVKSPTELVVGFLRSMEAEIAPADDEATLQLANQLNGATAAMGQQLFNPPTVQGWPGQELWVGTSALISRYNFIAAAARNAFPSVTIDVGATLAQRNLSTAEQIVDYYADLMVDGDLTDRQRKALLDYMTANDNGSKSTFRLDDQSIEKKVRGLIYLLGTTPQYQLS